MSDPQLGMPGSDEGRTRVAAAVRDAETRSLGQIVPVVVEKCDDYPEARYRGALLAAFAATLVVVLRFPQLPSWELPLVQVAAGVAGALLSLWDPIERLLVGPRELTEAARERAFRAFHEHGLHRTAQGTGVLVFAALFEHRAVILGDRGIHEKMKDGDWDRALAALVAGLRRGDPAAGFCDAIGLAGTKLAEHFPRSAGDAPTNELADDLRSSKR